MRPIIPAVSALMLLAAGPAPARPFPEAEIATPTLRARLYWPDAQSGFYRGTRFDWSGVIGSLQYAGHEFYPPWFQRSDPAVHDFVYEGADIVAGPCTAVTGPAEEFVANGKALGFDLAAPGGTFIKIGVGVLTRPDARPYDPYRLYPIKDGGSWTISRQPRAIAFTHTLADAATGYAYAYRKTVSLAEDKPHLTLEHSLRNTGRRVIETSVYNHNFLYLDRQPPGPEVTLTFPFALRAVRADGAGLATVRDRQITFTKTLAGEDRVYLALEGFGAEARDHDIRIENRRVGAGVRIVGDRPLSRLALWAIRAPLSIEPFIDMAIEPGGQFTWQTRYEYYTLPRSGE